jgi:murein DD-endopeptidase MepM/ murein hydrolase activator NlpD
VHRGDVIGYVGESGRSTGPHLHYEVRINDTPVNPYKYLRITVAHNGGFAAGS